MKFLVSLPVTTKLEDTALVATGSGLNWNVAPVLMTSLLEDAKRNVRFENVELRVLSAGQTLPNAKGKLIFGNEKATRLWVDTKPYAPSRFISGLVTILQEIRNEEDKVLGYVVALPDGRVLKVAAVDLYRMCAKAQAAGRYAVQNMKYVPDDASRKLWNYEGRTVPVYIHRRKPVNVEKTPSLAPKAPEAVTVPELDKPSAATVFTPEQLEVLGRGKKEGVNIRVYANPAYSAKHMDIIRHVLVNKKDPSLLLDPKLPYELVAFYGFDLANGADVRAYYNPAYTVKQATQVKLGVIRGLDVSKYASPTTDGDEMEQIRVRMDADMWSGITND